MYQILCVVFQPALKIKNRHQLAALLERNDREGLGGIKMSDVEEALANPQRAIRVGNTFNYYPIVA